MASQSLTTALTSPPTYCTGLLTSGSNSSRRENTEPVFGVMGRESVVGADMLKRIPAMKPPAPPQAHLRLALVDPLPRRAPPPSLLTCGNRQRLVADLWQLSEPKKLPQVSNGENLVATSQQQVGARADRTTVRRLEPLRLSSTPRGCLRPGSQGLAELSPQLSKATEHHLQ
ncbi:unannotated protein [freshwater metagenome]|uniref:Unannotated protein n=1 Tax=freshwater metagenome TaxID=449393 RepID=A0A6J7I7A1_9ZZZZ